jgi:hypothetical protein
VPTLRGFERWAYAVADQVPGNTNRSPLPPNSCQAPKTRPISPNALAQRAAQSKPDITEIAYALEQILMDPKPKLVPSARPLAKASPSEKPGR